MIGYDLLNEPWCGDGFSDGRLLLPGQAGRRLLSPLYDKLHTAIRSEDKEGLVLWEAVTWAHLRHRGSGYSAARVVAEP